MIFKPIIRNWDKRTKKMIKHTLRIKKLVGLNSKCLGENKKK